MSGEVRAVHSHRYVTLTWCGGSFDAMNIFTAAEARALMVSLGHAAAEAEEYERKNKNVDAEGAE